tara:strand:+ start:356 stop:688 length:333 start_codon:yes stop_codon:yes gene_type:complete
MHLLINGVEHQWDKEIEITRDELGFDCTITFKADSPFGDTVQVRRNCTEFHHLYNKRQQDDLVKVIVTTDYVVEYSSAFESDIHSTGGTHRVSYIESIVVDDSKVIHDKY